MIREFTEGFEAYTLHYGDDPLKPEVCKVDTIRVQELSTSDRNFAHDCLGCNAVMELRSDDKVVASMALPIEILTVFGNIWMRQIEQRVAELAELYGRMCP